MPTIGIADRAKQRERERKARERRAANVEVMRDTLKGFEGAVLAVHTLDDEAWGRFLNPNAMRVRGMLLLAKEAKNLIAEQAQLQRLLQEHQLSATAIAAILDEWPTGDWERDVKRWRELVRRHFKPWSLEACQHEIDAALKEVNAFRWCTEKQSTGVRFLGWGDQRRIDVVRGVFQFEFHKVFRGYDMMDYVNVGWDSYTDERTFREVIMGPRSLGALEVLQQLTPNLVIAHAAHRFPHINGDIHGFYLVFRVKTEQGFTQCFRSIHCPEMMDVIQGPNVLWSANFIWLQWDQLGPDQEKHAYRFRCGGSMGGIDITHMNQWMLDVFGVVLRSERLATGGSC